MCLESQLGEGGPKQFSRSGSSLAGEKKKKVTLQTVIAQPFQEVFIDLQGVLHSSAENISQLHSDCWLPSKNQSQKVIPKSHQQWHQPLLSCLCVLSKQKGLFEENHKTPYLLWTLNSVFKRRWKWHAGYMPLAPQWLLRGKIRKQIPEQDSSVQGGDGAQEGNRAHIRGWWCCRRSASHLSSQGCVWQHWPLRLLPLCQRKALLPGLLTTRGKPLPDLPQEPACTALDCLALCKSNQCRVSEPGICKRCSVVPQLFPVLYVGIIFLGD